MKVINARAIFQWNTVFYFIFEFSREENGDGKQKGDKTEATKNPDLVTSQGEVHQQKDTSVKNDKLGMFNSKMM